MLNSASYSVLEKTPPNTYDKIKRLKEFTGGIFGTVT